jgi:hypothetical protein
MLLDSRNGLSEPAVAHASRTRKKRRRAGRRSRGKLRLAAGGNPTISIPSLTQIPDLE